MFYSTLCCFIVSILSTSLYADTPSEQELREQLAIKQQELHELTKMVMDQEKLVEECANIVNTYIDRYLSRESSDNHSYKRALHECSNFFEYFLSDRKKNALLNMFAKDDSKLNFAKLYYLFLFYEKNVLIGLIEKWEQAAQQVNALRDQINSPSIRQSA